MEKTPSKPPERSFEGFGGTGSGIFPITAYCTHGHVLKCGPRSWRTKTDLPPQGGGRIEHSQSRTLLSLAGFEVITVSRF
jgi:hypothetical protein